MKVLIAARLSQRHEDETGLDDQERGTIRWAESHGHEVVGIAADHKTGASHLWDRPHLRPWVTEPERIAMYDAIVALKVDRLTRADDEGVDALKAWARKHHKQILISSADVHFPSEGVEGMRWDMYVRIARQEYLDIKDRYERMMAGRHDAGSIIGKPPWGYEIVRDGDGVKRLKPTPQGRLWIPIIFGSLAEGVSLKEVANRLEDNGVRAPGGGTRWYTQRLNAMAKTLTYSGTRIRNGRSSLAVEPLVSRALQDKANAELAARARMGPATKEHPKALLASLKCGHPMCPGQGAWPMYRVMKDGKPKWYRCAGRGAARRGCGMPMVDLDTLDRLVLDMAGYWDSKPYVSQRFVSGNDAGARVEQLRAEMSEAIRAAAPGDIPSIAQGYAERIEAVEAEGSVLPHWEDVETGMTEGEYLRSLGLDERREYLARKDIRAWVDAERRVCVTVDGFLARTGGQSAIGRLIDGIEAGEKAYVSESAKGRAKLRAVKGSKEET